ncbi:MAG: hypothetical protein WBY99_05420, partial [Kaistella sp.]
QETIDFEFSYPENSRFTVEQKIDNSGTMKITGSPQEIASIKKAGYNENRKLKYLINYTTDYKTDKRSLNSFPFEFSYSNILFDIDSDGKKQKKEMGFPNEMIKGDIVNGKLSVVKPVQTNSPVQDQYINSLPKYFTVEFPKISKMKIGESFTVDRVTDNKTEGYSLTGNLKYTLTKIENELSFFSISISQNNDKTSTLKSTGIGNGEMIYNHKDKYIVSEKMIIKMISISNEAIKMIVDNTIVSSYELKLK